MKTAAIASIFAFVSLAQLAVAADAEHADWLFTGKHIITMTNNNAVSAVAVVGSRIVWMGEEKAANAWRGEHTQMVELGERALLPGFIDAHGHLAFLATTERLANVASPPVGPVTNIVDLQASLASYIDQQDSEAGDWVIGSGYDDSLLTERRHPTRHDLDAVSTERPIALMHVSGHLAAANSLALERVGITADSEDPAGGFIRRESNTDIPNGVLEETATYPLRAFMFAPSDDPIADLEKAQHIYARHGITTAQDGAAQWSSVELLRAAANQNRLFLDVVAYPVMRDSGGLPPGTDVGTYRNRFKVGGIKLVLDGSPQGKTAFLSKPYAVPPEGQTAEYRGYPTFPVVEVNAMVSTYLEQRVPILAHANGDAAADMLIDAVSAASAGSDAPQDHRTVMIHAQSVREDQLEDMSRLQMIPSFFSAHTFYWGDWHRDSVFGPERGRRISPTRSAIRKRLHFTTHNDAPIVPPDMVRLLWATTNRLTRSGKTLGPEQRLSTMEALRTITVDAAYQYFEEDEKGSLAPGKLADLVMLSANPLNVPPSKLLDVQVDGTWSHGVRVW